jgi:hypothetical protein
MGLVASHQEGAPSVTDVLDKIEDFAHALRLLHDIG